MNKKLKAGIVAAVFIAGGVISGNLTRDERWANTITTVGVTTGVLTLATKVIFPAIDGE